MGLRPAAPLAPGHSVAHYTIVSRLGSGGMGDVFRAVDRKLDRHVAIKVLTPDLVSDADRLRLFEREARTLAALNHPNIVTIFSVEEADDSHFLVMEFVDGQTLRQTIAAGGLSVGRFLQIAVPLADALAVAHKQGVTHRDLKPENVMLTASGRVKVLDFGLAKFAHAPAVAGAIPNSMAATLAVPGAVLGTVPYMSPEQAEGRIVDHRSDIFSLGVVLYELLTGERPFKGDAAFQVMASILRDAPVPLERVRPDVPALLARTIDLCLEKDPDRRVQSASELRACFEECSRGRIEVAKTPASGRRLADAVRSVETPHRQSAVSFMLETRSGLTAILGILFAANWVETSLETAVKSASGQGIALGYEVSRAQRWLEMGLSFERHDLTNLVAVYGYSAAYFFALPLLLMAVAAALLRRADVRPYRIYCLTLAATYAASVFFFILFPTPERWAFPESEAILLSDLWSSKLIAAIRPISGLDNCFPSFHVASAVAAILVGYAFNLRYRTSILVVGLLIIMSTFVLGIHWLPDILAGISVGVIGFWAAVRMDAAFRVRMASSS